MAIIKMVKVRKGGAFGLKAALDYITDPEKTEKQRLVFGKDCLTETAYQQMKIVKQEYKQEKGRQYVHIIQSFDISDELTPETANEIGRRLLEKFSGFQGDGGHSYQSAASAQSHPPVNPSTYRALYKKAVGSVEGVRVLTPHCCRHTYITDWKRRACRSRPYRRWRGIPTGTPPWDICTSKTIRR